MSRTSFYGPKYVRVIESRLYISRVVGKKAIIAYTNSNGSGKPAHSRSFARPYVDRAPMRWAKEKL